MSKKILIVTANYYKDISQNLIKGSSEYCSSNNVDYDYIEVPGSFEIPFVIAKNINKWIWCKDKSFALHKSLHYKVNIWEVQSM